jgi:hypothetical protein
MMSVVLDLGALRPGLKPAWGMNAGVLFSALSNVSWIALTEDRKQQLGCLVVVVVVVGHRLATSEVVSSNVESMSA